MNNIKTTILNKFHKIFSTGNERSIKAKKNILYMFFLKGGTILIGLILIPLTLGYVDNVKYGIWVALSSMITWMNFFDIGISNGLKNKLAEALAERNNILCQKYISTTYAILTLIFIPLMGILLLISPFVNWENLLNIPNENSNELLFSINIIIIYFCINFILNTINTIITAEQKPATAALCFFLQQLFSLIVIYILTLTTEGSLAKLCMALCFSPLFVVFIFNIIFFKRRYKQIRPQIKAIDFSVASSLMKLGIQFFVIQIASIIQYQMINFLILRYYGATEVTEYNIAYKYFSVLTMIWGILTTPLWVAATDALLNKEFLWIKNAIKKYLVAFITFSIIGGIMVIISPIVYNLWVGNSIQITIKLSLWVLIYNLCIMFGTIFVMIINGSGQLKIQTYASLISPFVFIISCYLFIKINLGIESILIASIISNFNGLILAPIQCCRIIKLNSK